jgi:hypothetical protein
MSNKLKCTNCPGWQQIGTCIKCICRKCPVHTNCPGDDDERCIFDDDGNRKCAV